MAKKNVPVPGYCTVREVLDYYRNMLPKSGVRATVCSYEYVYRDGTVEVDIPSCLYDLVPFYFVLVEYDYVRCSWVLKFEFFLEEIAKVGLFHPVRFFVSKEIIDDPDISPILEEAVAEYCMRVLYLGDVEPLLKGRMEEVTRLAFRHWTKGIDGVDPDSSVDFEGLGSLQRAERFEKAVRLERECLCHFPLSGLRAALSQRYDTGGLADGFFGNESTDDSPENYHIAVEDSVSPEMRELLTEFTRVNEARFDAEVRFMDVASRVCEKAMRAQGFDNGDIISEEGLDRMCYLLLTEDGLYGDSVALNDKGVPRKEPGFMAAHLMNLDDLFTMALKVLGYFGKV